MRSITLCAICLILLTSSALIAANDNPFARWEQLSRQTNPDQQVSPEVRFESKARSKATAPVAITPKAKGTGGVSFFSPKSEEKPVTATATNKTQPGTKTAPATGTQSVTRERMRSAATQSATVKVDGFAASGNEGGGRARTADFQAADGKGRIQQTGGDFFEELPETAEPNPFAEFLSDDAASDESAMTDSSTTVDVPQFDGGPSIEPAESAFTNPAEPTPASESVEPTRPAFGTTDQLSGPQSPGVTLQWVHHGEFNLGQECRCDLVVENTSQTLIRNVETEAELPDGLQVLSAKPEPTSVSGTATWTFGELKPGEKRTVELVVVPQNQGDTNLSAFVRFTGASVSSFVVRQPMVAVEISGPENVEVGQQVNYTVQVTNPGTGKANNVLIQAAIPEGLEHRQGKMLAIDIGTLNPGEMRRARLSLTAVKGGDHPMAVRVVADGGLDERVQETVAVAVPKLNIGLRGQAVGRAGQLADYELIVVNEGGVDSSNVRAKYKVPVGFEFESADIGGKYNEDDRTIEWFVGTLEPNQARRFSVSLRSTQPGEARHQVGVISEHGKTTVAELTTSMKGNAELELKLAGGAGRVLTGEVATYTVRVNNVGMSPAENVGVSFELPPGLQLQPEGIEAPTDFIADNGVVIFRSLPTLDAGKSIAITLRAKCERPGQHNVRVRVASQSIQEALIDEATTSAVNR